MDAALRVQLADASHLVAVQDDTLAGRLEFFVAPPFELVLFHPTHVEAAALARVVSALATAARSHAAGLGAARLRWILEDRGDHAEALVALAPQLGFSHDVTKVLVRAPIERVVAAGGAALRAKTVLSPARGSKDPKLIEALAEVLATSVTESDRKTDATEFLAQMEERCRADEVFFPEDWQLARVGERAAGFVLPAFADRSRQPATNLYLGVLPWARSRGLAQAMASRGMRAMQGRGATRYVDSCDVRNAPMRSVFARLGCSRIATQTIFTAPVIA